ncbi:MAG TPA: hypothetical protein VF466_03010 [Candidatus Saccharimonadales bacterium]
MFISAKLRAEGLPAPNIFDGRRMRIEVALADRFPEMLAGIAFEETAVARANQTLPSGRVIGRYGFVALTSAEYTDVPDSRRYTAPTSLIVHGNGRLPDNPRSEPSMDASFGIGVTFDGLLFGLISMAVPDYNRPDQPDLLINGVQGYADLDDAGNYDPRRNKGLYTAVDWRRSAVRAAGKIAEETGAKTLGIIAANQSPWASKIGRTIAEREQLEGHEAMSTEHYAALGAAALYTSYNQVAIDEGFLKMRAGHWESTLPIGSNLFVDTPDA